MLLEMILGLLGIRLLQLMIQPLVQLLMDCFHAVFAGGGWESRFVSSIINLVSINHVDPCFYSYGQRRKEGYIASLTVTTY